MAITSFRQSQEPDRQPQSRQKKKGRSKKRQQDLEADLLLATATTDETENQEEGIRPQRLADYIGQKELKDILEIAIAAAKARNEALDHLLLYGPPGLGRCTFRD